jgi:GNAT superfamily N-acetyltransferase
MSGITIALPIAQDADAWRRLYNGYADFYQVPMNDQIADATWGWLLDSSHVMTGLIAKDGQGEAIGLAHFRSMPSPLRGAAVGFLDDLFVEPAARGSGAAGLLMDEIARIGRERGWPMFRWITADDNYRARALYDKVASKTPWNTYQYDL